MANEGCKYCSEEYDNEPLLSIEPLIKLSGLAIGNLHDVELLGQKIGVELHYNDDTEELEGASLAYEMMLGSSDDMFKHKKINYCPMCGRKFVKENNDGK